MNIGFLEDYYRQQYIVRRTLAHGFVYIFIIVMIVFSVNMYNSQFVGNGDYNDYISVNGKVMDSDIRDLQKEIKNLPQWILDEFVSTGGKVFVTNQKLESNVNNGFTTSAGQYRILKNEIWLNNQSDNIRYATLHEFGHFIDYQNSEGVSFSETDDFQIIFENEKAAFLAETREYYISSSSEYFAECFDWYINNPRKLKKICPETYNYMDMLINRG